MTGHRVVSRLLAVVAAALGSLAIASGASAGGWALTTLDAVPTPVPGEPTTVGFTIRQHGVTPVDLTEGVELVVTAPDGAATVFPAAGDGTIGHYTATIVVHSTGTYTWLVRQGWFGEQSLGALVAGEPGTAGGGGWDAPEPLVPALAVAAALLAGLALADVARARRRHAAATTGTIAQQPAPRPT